MVNLKVKREKEMQIACLSWFFFSEIAFNSIHSSTEEKKCQYLVYKLISKNTFLEGFISVMS